MLSTLFTVFFVRLIVENDRSPSDPVSEQTDDHSRGIFHHTFHRCHCRATFYCIGSHMTLASRKCACMYPVIAESSEVRLEHELENRNTSSVHHVPK